MEQCVEEKSVLMRRFIRGFFSYCYLLLARLARKYVSLSEHGFALQSQHELLRERYEILALKAEQLRLKNADLERQNTSLAELNREKDNLISVVAHDLRAPLNRSLSLCGFILPGLFTAEQKKIINLMIQVNNDGLQLVEGILNVDAAAYRDPSPVTINLRHFITDHLEKFFTGQAGKKGIWIHTAIENHLEITTDAHSLRRIIDNLVSNAVKFSAPDTNIFIRVLSIDDAIHISIQDQGPGISAEDQKKMFRKFQKLTAVPTSGETSTGLGLAIVKDLVEKLHGKITVNSELGQGTEFIIRLNKEFAQTPPLQESPMRYGQR